MSTLDDYMDKWRVIPLEEHNAYINTALDEVATNFAIKSNQPLLRFYQWKPNTVSLGNFQTVEDLDLQKCKFYDFDIVRRETGGKATIHTAGTDICYSIAVPFNNSNRLDVTKRYEYFCSKIANAIKDVGLKNVEVRGNDIFVNNQKISGNASRSKIDSYMQHGFIFYTLPNIQLMLKLINKSAVKNWKKLRGEDEITSLLSNVTITKKAICDQIVKNIAGKDYELSSWTSEEIDEADKLVLNKYKTKEWMNKGKQHKGLCYIIWD